MTRHNHRYGSTPEDFGHIAVVTREWATLNPRAVMFSKETNPAGGPITIDDVNNARLVSWPLTLLHCCLVTDHGGAVLVVSPEVARSVKTKPVWIAGAGESMSHSNMLEMDDFTATSAAASSAAAYKMAGMGPEDMEMAMLYDSFTVTAGITAEMVGLAPRGEGFTRWKDGHAAPGGKFPMNTNGGGLSFNHSGMYGMQLLIEAYRQLSGTAEDNGSAASPASRQEPRAASSTAQAAPLDNGNAGAGRIRGSRRKTTNGRRMRRPFCCARHGQRRLSNGRIRRESRSKTRRSCPIRRAEDAYPGRYLPTEVSTSRDRFELEALGKGRLERGDTRLLLALAPLRQAFQGAREASLPRRIHRLSVQWFCAASEMVR